MKFFHYEFDVAGRMIALATTRSNAYANVNLNTLVPSGKTLSSPSTQNSALDITRWCYDEATRLLTNKVYADGNGTAYTYTDSGRLATRTWARGITTTYSYDSLGQLTEVDYSLWSTPDVTYTHDRLGRMTSAVSTASTNIFEYSGLALTKETQANYIIERIYDTLGRAIGYELYSPDDLINPVQTIIYGYSSNGRLVSVSSVHSVVTNTFTYAFLPGTDLISGYTSSAGFVSLREYEFDRNLITAITNAWNSTVISSFDYTNDPLGRRTKRFDNFNSLLSTNVFSYNSFGELIEASMNNGTDNYDFNYDPIGNREKCIIDNGELTITNSYSANNLNQYTSVSSVPSVVYPRHDDDGNMTYDGSLWHHSWDAENRLIKSEPNTVTNGAYMLEYKLNYSNLRVEKKVRQLSGRDPSYPMNPLADSGTWNEIETRKYIWDGFNIVAEIILDHVIPATNISYYTWGLDLSGSLQGAGGVGGLLSDTRLSSTETNSYYALGDANGNVTEYVDNTGTVKAHYEYSATGEEVYSSGVMKNDFTHRFSTKPFDSETGLVQYQRRPYDPVFNRFLSRDPVGIRGGLNEYGFVNNDAVNKWDLLGKCSLTIINNGSMYQGADAGAGGYYLVTQQPTLKWKNKKCKNDKVGWDLNVSPCAATIWIAVDLPEVRSHEMSHFSCLQTFNTILKSIASSELPCHCPDQCTQKKLDMITAQSNYALASYNYCIAVRDCADNGDNQWGSPWCLDMLNAKESLQSKSEAQEKARADYKNCGK